MARPWFYTRSKGRQLTCNHPKRPWPRRLRARAELVTRRRRRSCMPRSTRQRQRTRTREGQGGWPLGPIGSQHESVEWVGLRLCCGSRLAVRAREKRAGPRGKEGSWAIGESFGPGMLFPFSLFFLFLFQFFFSNSRFKQDPVWDLNSKCNNQKYPTWCKSWLYYILIIYLDKCFKYGAHTINFLEKYYFESVIRLIQKWIFFTHLI